MHVLVSGTSGLVGRALLTALRKNSHSATALLRPGTRIAEDFKFGRVAWDPDAGYIDAESLHRLDAVVHLGGENISGGRWTNARKAAIRRSRVDSTRLLAETIAKRSPRPAVFVCASAVGYYGDRGTDIMTEESAPGSGFLADVCKDWEAATAPATEQGIRTVHLRIGIVLSARGGALAKMLTPFRLGVGGRIGTGSQFMSWIALDDLVRAIVFALETESLNGAVNAVAPRPVTNAEFTRTLGGVLGRPTVFPMPAFAARAAFGEMADALLLASTRVRPARLEEAGFTFQYPELEGALRAVLKKA
jgi:uncharacterized protein (TIGR01777 family)